VANLPQFIPLRAMPHQGGDQGRPYKFTAVARLTVMGHSAKGGLEATCPP
jgi:hypothetical protein